MVISTGIPCEAELPVWTAATPSDFAGADATDVRVHADSLVLLSTLPEDRNVALDRRATDEFGRQLPLVDGTTETEWLSGTPKVVGRQFTVDLGLDRSVTRVRVLMGVTGRSRPEYFMRGYRLEAATQVSPDFWRLLAEDRRNQRLDVDTRADSTWLVVDGEGRQWPRLGRYVRLELVSQDRSNWVTVGEIEVYADGYAEEGTITDRLEFPGPVNVGRVYWQATTPEGTQVRVAVRGAGAGGEWAEWQEMSDAGPLYGGPEPVAGLEYRGTLQTADPHATPALQRLVVEYDPVLVARRVTEVTAPDTVRKGERTAVTVGAVVEVTAGDYGVDQLRLEGVCLEVSEVRLDGFPLPHDASGARGYRRTCWPSEERTVVELAAPDRISAGTVEMEIVGEALFLHDLVPVQVQVASHEQASRDGFANWQNGPRVAVRSLGLPPDLLTELEVSPSPFSPFRGGQLDFRFVVANLRDDARISVAIYRLDGRRVWRLAEEGRARSYHFAWDGRGDDGEIVDPGLYLYEVRVAHGDGGGNQRGALVVAY